MSYEKAGRTVSMLFLRAAHLVQFHMYYTLEDALFFMLCQLYKNSQPFGSMLTAPLKPVGMQPVGPTSHALLHHLAQLEYNQSA